MQDAKGFKTVECDLRAEEDLENYWCRLEYCCKTR